MMSIAMMKPNPAMLAFDNEPFGLFDLFEPLSIFDPHLRMHDCVQAKRRRLAVGDALQALRLTREDDHYVVTAALPGVKASDIEVELVGHKTVDIRVMQRGTAGNGTPRLGAAEGAPTDGPHANKSSEEELNLSDKHRIAMHRSVSLPQLVDADGVTCSYRDGLLRIDIPVQAPPAAEDDTRVDALKHEAEEAQNRVAEAEKKLVEYRTQAAAALEALRNEKRAALRALQSHRHALTLA